MQRPPGIKAKYRRLQRPSLFPNQPDANLLPNVARTEQEVKVPEEKQTSYTDKGLKRK